MQQNQAKSTIRALTSLILITFLISACSTPEPQKIEIRSTPIERPKLILPSTTPIKTKPVVWKIITPENVNQVFDEMKSNNITPVLFAVTATGYENISLNHSDILRLVKEKNAIIVAYNTYYEKADRTISENNSRIKK